jgi:hypothetical protein
MRIKIDKNVRPWKLTRELRAAGVSLLHNVAALPKMGLFLPLADESQGEELLPVILATIEAHDGIDDIAEKEADAEARAKKIPGWATWDETQALAWFDENIAPLNIPADVKALLLAYGRLLLALRDEAWPQLGDQ